MVLERKERQMEHGMQRKLRAGGGEDSRLKGDASQRVAWREQGDYDGASALTTAWPGLCRGLRLKTDALTTPRLGVKRREYHAYYIRQTINYIARLLCRTRT